MIKGINFDNQYTTAKQFGAFLSRALSDGRIYGADVTYSGANVVINTGVIMACGRAIELTSSETIKTTQASGYAQIILNVDLTKAATTSSFGQAYFTARYNTSNSFAELTKENVNANGSLYQMEVAVVTLSSSTVTGIVRKYAESGSIAIADEIKNAIIEAASDYFVENESGAIVDEAVSEVMSTKLDDICTSAATYIMNNKLSDIRTSCYDNFKLSSGLYGSSLPAVTGKAEGSIFFLV